MKSILFALCLAASAFAQSIEIGAPAEYSSITPGSNITVQVDRPDTLTGSQEVAIVIALNSCVGHGPNGSCSNFDVTQDLGHILYVGPYSPAFHDGSGLPEEPPYQNFSVQVPDLPQGEAALTVSHFSLIGAGPFPNLEVKNITLNVV